MARNRVLIYKPINGVEVAFLGLKLRSIGLFSTRCIYYLYLMFAFQKGKNAIFGQNLSTSNSKNEYERFIVGENII